MDLGKEIAALVGFRGRGAGTDAERRAANHLAERLRSLGRDAEVQPIEIWPRWAAALALLALLGIAASMLSTSSPEIGAALALVATLGAVLEPAGLPLARRLTGWRASQNVVSREETDKAGVLVLVAHYDAGGRGQTIAGRLIERTGRMLRRPPDPVLPLLACMLAVLACAGLRVAGVDGSPVVAVQFAGTVGLILAVPLLLGVALAGTAGGENDNASGVATALRLAESHGGALEHFDLWLLLPGAQGAIAGGMRRFVRRHRKELDRASTVFVNLDAVGAGSVRFARREGLVLAARPHRQLLELCEDVAEDDGPDGHFGAEPIVLRAPTDASAARSARYPAITICCRDGVGAPPDEVDDDALERAYGFTAELIERIDAEIGPELDPVGT